MGHVCGRPHDLALPLREAMKELFRNEFDPALVRAEVVGDHQEFHGDMSALRHHPMFSGIVDGSVALESRIMACQRPAESESSVKPRKSAGNVETDRV